MTALNRVRAGGPAESSATEVGGLAAVLLAYRATAPLGDALDRQRRSSPTPAMSCGHH